jgi:predicted DCC family thiol-disulfide oxidoreductase YuxK
MKAVSVRLSDPGDFLLYDGECPVCSAFVAMARLRQARPGLELRNARDFPALVTELRAAGIEINDAFAVQINGQLLHGAEAMRLVSGLASPNSLAARLILSTVGSRYLSTPLYPVLVLARKALLLILGRKLIA